MKNTPRILCQFFKRTTQMHTLIFSLDKTFMQHDFESRLCVCVNSVLGRITYSRLLLFYRCNLCSSEEKRKAVVSSVDT